MGTSTPPPGLLKINSDGAFVSDTLTGGRGFIIRDHSGEAVVAGAGRLAAVPDVIAAESLACSKALLSGTKYGISRVQIEVDSSVLKQAISSSSMDLAACGMLIGDIRPVLNSGLSLLAAASPKG
jgi:ribonuclease HI